MSGGGGSDPHLGARRRRPRGGARFVRDLVVILLAALVVSFVLKTFVVRSFYIPSASMENTLQINDRIVVDELVPTLSPLKRGDVVVFTDPGGWLGGGESADGNHLIKRIVGLPGDRVSCCDSAGDTEVDGVPLVEPYVRPPSDAAEVANSDKAFSVTVPAGSLWVEGDNRGDSEDSRFHRDLPSGGFVPISDVVGTAVVITWPISRWAWLGAPADPVVRPKATPAPS